MYLSAGQTAPTDEAMNWLVEDAIRLWKNIPSWEIPRMIDQAIIESAPYVATAAMVTKCWMDSGKKELDRGSGRMSEKETHAYFLWMNDPDRTGSHTDKKYMEQK